MIVKDDPSFDPEFPERYDWQRVDQTALCTVAIADQHWQEHCPRMYRELEENGQLGEMLYAAQEMTASTLKELRAQGVLDN